MRAGAGIVLLLDGVDLFADDAAESEDLVLSWLPRPLPAGVRALVLRTHSTSRLVVSLAYDYEFVRLVRGMCQQSGVAVPLVC